MGEGGTPLSEFQAAARKFLARDDREVDLGEYRAVIDSLDGDFSSVAREAQRSGAHLVGGNITAASWIARTCDMSVNSAADRLCVGEQLESLPRLAAALAAGEVGYQSVSILCQLRDVPGEKRELFDEDEMLGFARRFSVFHLRQLCSFARQVADPDGCFDEAEESYTRRRMQISQMSDGMYKATGELANHAMDKVCYHHHRLVHEGGWQVVKSGREFRFLPPDRVVMRRARGPGMRWAA